MEPKETALTFRLKMRFDEFSFRNYLTHASPYPTTLPWFYPNAAFIKNYHSILYIRLTINAPQTVSNTFPIA